jgi:hypothetical protein
MLGSYPKEVAMALMDEQLLTDIVLWSWVVFVLLREQIQAALDEGETKEWHLVGVSDVLPERGVILFWDTARPSFGRRGSS